MASDRTQEAQGSPPSAASVVIWRFLQHTDRLTRRLDMMPRTTDDEYKRIIRSLRDEYLELADENKLLDFHYRFWTGSHYSKRAWDWRDMHGRHGGLVYNSDDNLLKRMTEFGLRDIVVTLADAIEDAKDFKGAVTRDLRDIRDQMEMADTDFPLPKDDELVSKEISRVLMELMLTENSTTDLRLELHTNLLHLDELTLESHERILRRLSSTALARSTPFWQGKARKRKTLGDERGAVRARKLNSVNLCCFFRSMCLLRNCGYHEQCQRVRWGSVGSPWDARKNALPELSFSSTASSATMYRLIKLRCLRYCISFALLVRSNRILCSPVMLLRARIC